MKLLIGHGDVERRLRVVTSLVPRVVDTAYLQWFIDRSLSRPERIVLEARLGA